MEETLNGIKEAIKKWGVPYSCYVHPDRKSQVMFLEREFGIKVHTHKLIEKDAFLINWNKPIELFSEPSA